MLQRNIYNLTFFFIIITLLFLLLAFWGSNKKIEQFILLNRAEKNLIHAIKEKTDSLKSAKSQSINLLKIDNPVVDAAAALKCLMQIFQLNGMRIQSIQLLKNQTINGLNILPVNGHMLGIFSQFEKLMMNLAKNSFPIVIDDFSLQIDDSNNVTLKLQLFLSNLPEATLKSNYLENQFSNTECLMHSVVLEKIKWAGFIKQKKFYWGLVMLPDGKTCEVRIGAVIGAERGRVISVSEQGLLVKVGKNKFKI
jgi:hypothetical protein